MKGEVGWGQTPVPMSSQPGLSYTENFADIANWANNFASGIGANRWTSYPITAGGSANDGIRTTKSSATFVTSTSGGVQKGTGNFVFLSTGSGATSEAVAVDLLLNFSGVNAGTLSYNWAAVDNSSGTRPTSLRIFWSTDGVTFTEITGAQVLDVQSPSTGSITTIALPSAFNNSSTARLRFYNHAGTVTGGGNRDKISIDDVTVTAVASSPSISTSGTLSAVSTIYGTATVSPSSFSVSGSSMTAGISVKPPVGFEVSTSSTFASNVGDNAAPIIVGASGTIASTPVYVRLKATATVAGSPYSGDIECSSTSATTKTVATVSSTVSPAPLTITGLTGTSKEYDGLTTASFTGTPDYSGLVNGESGSVTGSPVANFTDAAAANGKTINITGYDAYSSNYSLTQPSLTADITKAPLTITGLTGSNKVYNGLANASFTGTPAYDGLKNSETFSVSGTATASFASVDVANGITINVSGYTPPNTNYSLTQPVLSGNITPAPLNITADDVTKVEGTTLTGGAGSTAFTTTPLAGAETVGTVTIAYGPSGAAGAIPGVYPFEVIPSDATGGTFNPLNYLINYITGTVTVTSASAPVCPQSTAVAPSGAQTVCQDAAAAQLTATVTYTGLAGTPTVQYQWYYNTTNSYTISGATAVSGANAATFTPATGATEVGDRYYFCVAYAADNGCGQTATTQSLASTAVKVTVNATPVAPTGPATQTFCSGDSPTVAFLGATGSGIKWYDAASNGALLSPTTALTDATHYYASQTVNGCESVLRLDVLVTINTTPAPPTANSPQSFCSATNPKVSDLVAVGTNLVWWDAATNGSPVSPGTSLSNNSHLFAAQVVGGCESPRLDVLILVTTNPGAPTGAATQSFCQAQSPTVAGLVAAGSNIQWYDAATNGSLLLATDPLVDGVHYFAEQTLNGCVSSARLDVTVSLIPTPAAPTGSAAQTFCSGANPTVAALAATGSDIKWYDAATNGTLLTAGTALTDATHYYASQVLNGCESADRLDVLVTITPTPAAPTGTAAQTFCAGRTVASLVATGTDIKWYSSAVSTTPLLSTVVLVNNSHYFATQTVNGCESTTRFDVTATVQSGVNFGSLLASNSVNHVVISQVYGGGGNSGALYTNDFIELYNPTNSSVSLSGWSVQYNSAAGATWTTANTTNLSGTIAPHSYFLIQQAAGAGGTTALPAPDVVGIIAMSGTAFKVALVNSTSLLSGACPSGASIIDFVGVGSTASCFEGTGPTGTLSNTTAAIRGSNGCADNDQNSTDFNVGAPTPRNSSSASTTCPGPANVTVCSGTIPGNMSVSGASGGSGTFTYQWYSHPGTTCPTGSDLTGWTSLGTDGGANTISFTPTTAVTSSTTFACYVTPTGTPACTSGWASGCRQVIVNTVTGGTVAGDQSLCNPADPAPFTVTDIAIGAGTLTYQWQVSTSSDFTTGVTNISGAESDIYAAPAGLTATSYYRRITTSTLNGVSCSANSNAITVTVNPVTGPTTFTAPALIVCQDAANTTYTATAANSTSITYSVLPVGAGVINASTGEMDWDAAFTGDAHITATATGLCGTTSATADVTVKPTTIITNQPWPTQTICLSVTPTNLTVVATGTGLSYQWYSNSSNSNSGGTLIPGATDATYVPVTTTAGTTYYYCVVTGDCGAPASATSKVEIQIAAATPVITSPICAGATSVSGTSAEADGSFVEVFVNGSSAGFTTVTGGAWTLSPVTALTAGDLVKAQVFAPGKCISEFSAITTVSAATVISADPSGGSFCTGGDLTLTVNATGTNLHYQWKNGATNVGSDQNTYTATAAGSYTVVVSGDCGTLTSAAAMVTENTVPVVEPITGTTTFCKYTYSQLSNATPGGTWSSDNINAQFQPTPGLLYGNLEGTADVHYTVTNGCGSTTVNATVTIQPATMAANNLLTTQTRCVGQTAQTLFASSYGVNITRQWYSNTTNSATGGTLLAGETNAAYTPPTSTVGTMYYYCEVAGTCGSYTTNVSEVIVTANTVVTSFGPATQSVCQGTEAANLNITATGTGTLTYQWYSNVANSNTGGTAISGAESTSYTPSTAAAGTTYYYCVVTGTCGAVASATASVTVTAVTENTTTASACDTYTWSVNGQTYTASGTYTVVTGCHTEILDLTINHSSSHTTTLSACDSYTWAAPLGDGLAHTASGTFTHESVNAAGCAHIETLMLTINNSTSHTTTLSACDSYTWSGPLGNGTTYTSSGTYTSITTNAAGCNHTEILMLTINTSTVHTTTASACTSYTWEAPLGDGNTYNVSGTYTHVSVNAAGCPHTETLELTISNNTSHTTTASACDTYTWSSPLGTGNAYTVSGTYTNVTTNGAGCTHTETLVLTINQSTAHTTTLSACDSYTWDGPLGDGLAHTASGTFTHESVNAAGCAHIETLVLTINQSTAHTTTLSACDSYTWDGPLGDGLAHTASGTFTHESVNAAGCAHIETLVLTINNSTSHTTTAAVCDSYTWSGPLGNGTTYTSSGTYTSITTNAAGCPHTETLMLTITPSTNNTTTATACGTYTWTVNGQTYNASGTYTSVTGCHTETLNLTIITGYTITATSGSGGTITPAGAVTVSCGGSQAFHIAANSGNTIADVKVDGVSVGALSDYTFTSVNETHTIEAFFNTTSYIITATAGTGGTIAPAGVTTLSPGGSQTYTITTNPGFVIADVKVDGVSNAGAISSGTYSFTNVNADHTIAATFNALVSADPALVSIDMTDLANGSANPNLTPFHASRRIHIPVLNLALSAGDIIPAGSTKLRINLGTRLQLNTGYDVTTAPLNNYFHWSSVSEGDSVVIYGDQYADISGDFADETAFDVMGAGATGGTSFIKAIFQITNHNTTSGFLVDANMHNDTTILYYTELDQLVVNEVSHTNVGCNGGSDGTITVLAAGGLAPYQYKIGAGAFQNGGITNFTFNGLSAGTYTITAMDNLGYTATTTVTVSEPAVLVATGSGTNVSCNGGNNGTATVTVTGGTEPYTYLWSNGATTQNISGLVAGTYSVTVTDDHGCTATGSYTVTQPAVLVATGSGTNVSCNGGNNGTATVTVTGGTEPYTYLWSNGATTQSISGLTAGTYNVTVTDAHGCEATASYTVTQPAVLVATGSGTNVSCNGGNNGTATVTVTGGTEPYTYLWSNGATTQSISGLTAGTYNVTVTDAHGCEATASYTVTQPAVLVATGSGTNVSCNGGNNGTATVTVTGGTEPYTYLWSNGATTQSISGLVAGTYSVTVTDDHGCTATGSYTVTEPNVLVATGSGTNVSCNSGTNGTATVTVTGGTAPYTYLWSTGATTQSISGLVAGTYSVTVTDDHGCTATGSYTVTQPTQLFITLTGINQSNCAGSNSGSVTFSGTGGTPAFQYQLNGGQLQSSGTFSGLAPGTYTVTVVDANGCTATSAPFTMTEALNTDITVGANFTNNLFPVNGSEVTVVYNLIEAASLP